MIFHPVVSPAKMLQRFLWKNKYWKMVKKLSILSLKSISKIKLTSIRVLAKNKGWESVLITNRLTILLFNWCSGFRWSGSSSQPILSSIKQIAQKFKLSWTESFCQRKSTQFYEKLQKIHFLNFQTHLFLI